MPSRLRISLPRTVTRSPCEAVQPIGGITRLGCGLLYYSPGSPSYALMSRIGQMTSVNYLGGFLGVTTVDNPFGKVYGQPNPPYSVSEHGDARLRIPGLPMNSGYIQCNIGNEHDDIVPALGFHSWSDATQCQMERRGIAGFFTWGGAGLAGGGQPCGPSPGGAIVAVELRADRQLRGWSDPGGDPRVGYNSGPCTMTLPAWPMLYALNDVNGMKGRASFGATTLTKGRAVTFSNAPHSGSVRISVAGVVQVFPGPLNYMNLSAAGAGTWDPNAGIWWPSLVRYEFFSAAALGGVLVSDLTIARSWGGDVIGAP